MYTTIICTFIGTVPIYHEIQDLPVEQCNDDHTN